MERSRPVYQCPERHRSQDGSDVGASDFSAEEGMHRLIRMWSRSDWATNRAQPRSKGPQSGIGGVEDRWSCGLRGLHAGATLAGKERDNGGEHEGTADAVSRTQAHTAKVYFA